MMHFEEDVPSENVLPFEMDNLPDFVLQKAIVELNETSETKYKELEKLKDLVLGSQKMADIIFEDDFLRCFLRRNKYDVSKAFVQLQNFIQFRRKYRSVFQSISERCFETMESTKVFSVLPFRGTHGCTVVLLELGKWDPSELDIDDLKRLGYSMYIQLLRDPMTQINGLQVIHDFKGTSAKHLRYCTPGNLYFLYHSGINCVPHRYKEIYMVNESAAMKVLWNIMKNFLSEKMNNRIFFHSKPEDLLNYFHRSILPVQYGGDLIDYHNKDMIKKMNVDFGKTPLGGDKNYF